MTIQSPTPQNSENQMDIVLPFTGINLSSLAIVGGKAASLGEMIHAGLPVPPGFCITTTAYTLVAERSHIETLLEELATTDANDTSRVAKIATALRTRLLEAPIPDHFEEVITDAYRMLGHGECVPVAVRSSATAEDLPYASFAGQQETFLNIVGIDALIFAVRQCWASLWTDRAVSYRGSLGIDQRSVRIAVAIQRMVDATVAGILFTANPLSGKRHQAVIDASPGLGEAIVSGAVNPDHFVINAMTGGGTQRIEHATQINEACLTDEQIRALANLGAKVEAHFGVPQDIEWAINASNHIWLTQARPITTLYPLPATVPATPACLDATYLSKNGSSFRLRTISLQSSGKAPAWLC